MSGAATEVAMAPADPSGPADPGFVDGFRAVARLSPAVRPFRWKFVATMTASALTQAGTVAVSVGSAWLAGSVLTRADGWWDGPARWVALVAVAGALVAALATWWEMYIAHDLAYVVLAAFRVRLFDRLRRVLPRRDGDHRSGDLAATAMGDIESLEWIYAHVLGQVVVAAVAWVAGGVALFVLMPLLLAVAAVAALVVGSIPWWWQGRAVRDGAEARAAQAELVSEVVDTIQGLPELTAANALDRRRELLDRSSQRVDRAGMRQASRLGREAAAGDVAVSGAAIAALVAVSLLARDGGIQAPMAPVVMALVGAVLAPAAAVAGTLRELGGLRAAATRIFGLLDLPDPAPQPTHPAPPGEPGEPGSGPVLSCRGVRFAYRAETPVLDGIDLDVHEGEIVALVGRSGAGKSTLLSLLLRWWDPDEGTVSLDGVNLRDLDDNDLRRRVSAVPQEVQLFSGTVADNVRLGAPGADDAAVRAALDVAQLGDLIDTLPAGPATLLGEGGATLSGGQRARLAMARALVVGPRLLVLDEATANLDTLTEAAMHRGLQAGRAGRATVVVAHRPSTIAMADRVVVLDEGRIVEEGRYDELIAGPSRLRTILATGSLTAPA